MSNPIDKDDERWLDALAGKPIGDKNYPASIEALAVRKALQARVQRLAEDVPVADDALLEQLRFRLRREQPSSAKTVFRRPTTWALAASVLLGVALLVKIGLIGDQQPDSTIVALRGADSSLAKTEPEVRQPLVGATLVASTDPKAKVKSLIRGMPMKDPDRSEGATVGASAGRTSTLASWFDLFSWIEAKRSFEALSGLFREQVRSGVPVVIELGQDQIMLVIQATDDMLEYLRSQDIEPIVTDGEIVILIHSEEAPAPEDIRP